MSVRLSVLAGIECSQRLKKAKAKRENERRRLLLRNPCLLEATTNSDVMAREAGQTRFAVEMPLLKADVLDARIIVGRASVQMGRWLETLVRLLLVPPSSSWCWKTWEPGACQANHQVGPLSVLSVIR